MAADAAAQAPGALIALAQNFDVHPNQIKQWRDQLVEGATGVFGEAGKPAAEPAIDVKTLHAKIGALTLENDPPQDLRGPTGATVPAPMSVAPGPRRVCWRAPEDDRSRCEAVRQPPGCGAGDQPGCGLLPTPAGQRGRPEADETLIDHLHTDHPFAGSRMLQVLLIQEGFKLGAPRMSAR